MPQKFIPIVAATDTGGPSGLFVVEAQNTIYVRRVTGWFASWRWAMVWITQLVFYGTPWLEWNGRQAVLFDLAGQRFFLWGLALYPQDLIYLAVLLMLCALALFFFTAVAGRLWCGYACPQTVYTELFLWIEHHTEGPHHARKRLDGLPWSAEKLARKGGKHLLWLALALWTGFTFVGYFTPIQTLAGAAGALALGSWESFWILFYGLATYANAGYLREQVCKHMCPYARFQGAMMDRDTLVIGYDAARGESRGSRPRSADPRALGLGDCIDCSLCVQVCPTGIDIRQGLQSNCIACAACIDVCDSVMDQMRYPRGLIRYSTENGLAGGCDRSTLIRRVLRPRVLLYGAMLLVLVIGMVVGLSQRSPVRVDVIRDRGVLARVLGDGAVENVYRLHIMNATESAQRYRIQVVGSHRLELLPTQDLVLGPVEARTVAVGVRLPAVEAAGLAGQKLPVQFAVRPVDADGGEQALERSIFHVPR
jgi:cytochrome c oxidase accessory protein FixG